MASWQALFFVFFSIFFCSCCYSLTIGHTGPLWRHDCLTPIHQYWFRSECHLVVFIPKITQSYSVSQLFKCENVTHVTRCPVLWIATKYFYFWAFNIVILGRDSNPGLWVSVYLNLTHALNHSATTAGWVVHLWA